MFGLQNCFVFVNIILVPQDKAAPVTLFLKTPCLGDPRVNIQNDKGKAKPYQVKQVLEAVKKLKESKNEH